MMRVMVAVAALAAWANLVSAQEAMTIGELQNRAADFTGSSVLVKPCQLVVEGNVNRCINGDKTITVQIGPDYPLPKRLFEACQTSTSAPPRCNGFLLGIVTGSGPALQISDGVFVVEHPLDDLADTPKLEHAVILSAEDQIAILRLFASCGRLTATMVQTSPNPDHLSAAFSRTDGEIRINKVVATSVGSLSGPPLAFFQAIVATCINSLAYAAESDEGRRFKSMDFVGRK